jgi:hypothetical protein
MNKPLKNITMVWDCGQSVVTLVQIALYIPAKLLSRWIWISRPALERGLVKIPQIGNVIIGNNVEIGANSCVDRGKFSSTVLGMVAKSTI